jgi:predicted transcriptional regulator
MTKNNKRDVKRAATIKETAEVIGLSTSQVQKVLRDERDNPKIIDVFMELSERKQKIVDELRQRFNHSYSNIA